MVAPTAPARGQGGVVMPPGGRPGSESEACAKARSLTQGSVWLLHPGNGCVVQACGKAGLWLVMASSLSGQAQARAPCQAAPPGVWVWYKAWEGGRTRHPLESFPMGRGYESTPRDKVQTTTWTGSQEPTFSVCPALPSQTELPSPHMHHLLSPPGLYRLPLPRTPHSHL